MTKQSHRWRFHFLDVFLVFIPISLVLDYLHVSVILSFLASAAALAALTYLMTETTAIIARRVSGTISALFKATFGNAVEFFVAIFALQNGLVELVKASIVGSIIINVLLLIGLAMFAGGLKYKEQRFNKDAAGIASTMLIIVVVGLALPSIYSMVVGKPAEVMSVAVSIILGTIYVLGIVYSLWTHKHLFIVEREAADDDHGRWSSRAAVAILLGSTLLTGLESSVLVHAIEPLVSTTGITQKFMGLVFIAMLTNIPDHLSAINFARRNNITLSLEIGMGSATQMALFVVPVLVLISSAVTGNTLNLVFGPFELAAVVITAMIANSISPDGVCHWLEGAQLIAIYLLIATAFYFL